MAHIDVKIETSAPTVNEDISDGYIIGQLWFHSTTGYFYICTDNTATVAVWTPFLKIGTNPEGATTLSGDGDVALTVEQDDNGTNIINFKDASSIKAYIAYTGIITAVNFVPTSDRKLKKNIKPLKKGTKDLIVVSFERKDNPGVIQYGFIAQDMLKTHPELVGHFDEDTLSIDILSVIGLLTKDVQDLMKYSLVYQIVQLFKRIKKLWP